MTTFLTPSPPPLPTTTDLKAAFQTERLKQLFAINEPLATLLAPLVFGGSSR
jgi:hypothetical protein